jgi:hypothetical protein
LARYRPDASAREVTRLVELRMGRQELLRGLHSCQVWAIVELAALRDQQVDRHTRRAQITHLINMTEEPNITLQVLLPLAPKDNVTIGEPITHFRFPEEHLGDVVFTERLRSGFFLADRVEIDHYCQILSALAIRAAPSAGAQDLLLQLFREI